MPDETLKIWELYRAQVMHDEKSMQHRSSWLLLTSAVLLVVYAVIATLSSTVTIQQTLFRGYLLLLITLAGILLNLLGLIDLIGSTLSIRTLAKKWSAIALAENERNQLSPLFASARGLWLGRTASIGSCVVLISMWFIVFFITVTFI